MAEAVAGKPRLFLVDDHALVRRGIRLLLESADSATVVGEAESGEAALEAVPLSHPDIVVLDLTMPGLHGIDTAHALKRLLPELRLIALSMHEDAQHVKRFFEAGGSGYVSKNSLDTELLDAVAAVARGERYVPNRLLLELAQHHDRPTLASPSKLTERERDVLVMIAQGRTYRDIAALLGISGKTVATHRDRAAEKLGLTTRADLVRWTLESGLLG